MGPTEESLEKTGRGTGRKKMEHKCMAGGEVGVGNKEASSNQMRTGMLLRRQTSDAKLLFK